MKNKCDIQTFKIFLLVKKRTDKVAYVLQIQQAAQHDQSSRGCRISSEGVTLPSYRTAKRKYKRAFLLFSVTWWWASILPYKTLIVI